MKHVEWCKQYDEERGVNPDAFSCSLVDKKGNTITVNSLQEYHEALQTIFGKSYRGLSLDPRTIASSKTLVVCANQLRGLSGFFRTKYPKDFESMESDFKKQYANNKKMRFCPVIDPKQRVWTDVSQLSNRKRPVSKPVTKKPTFSLKDTSMREETSIWNPLNRVFKLGEFSRPPFHLRRSGLKKRSGEDFSWESTDGKKSGTTLESWLSAAGYSHVFVCPLDLKEDRHTLEPSPRARPSLYVPTSFED
jgi:hypothetical protein